MQLRTEPVHQLVLCSWRTIIRVPLGLWQEAQYQAVLRRRQGSQRSRGRRQSLTSPELRTLATTGAPWPGTTLPLVTPKLYAVLRVIERIFAAAEQGIVFSSLHAPLDALSALLGEAAVPHAVLDGRMPPSRRQEASKQFRAGQFPLILCGLESCGRGHNWPTARHVLLLDEGWAWDRRPQSVDRAHRLTSTHPVQVYRFITAGTADEIVLANLQAKDASNRAALGEAPRRAELHESLTTICADIPCRYELGLRAAWAEVQTQIILARGRSEQLGEGVRIMRE